MAGQTRARVRRFGLGAACDIRAVGVALDWPRGTRFTLQAAGQTRQVTTRLIGRPMVYALLAAVAVGLEAGCGLDRLLARLARLGPTPGRLEAVSLPQRVWLLRDDFKATVETIDAALDVLAEVPAERRIVVLGEIDDPPADRPPDYQRLGERVGRLAARAVFVGGVESFQQYAAVALLQQDLRAGDVVLVKGRWGQRLDRVALALAGRQVGCDISYCSARAARCGACPMLARGWRSRRIVT
jgi:UDP-N-acetylmuramoyl-tripeptide--D-alanyl-D-alanine ligase